MGRSGDGKRNILWGWPQPFKETNLRRNSSGAHSVVETHTSTVRFGTVFWAEIPNHTDYWTRFKR